MPDKPLHPCAHAGCYQLTSERYCPAHAALHADDRKARPGQRRTKWPGCIYGSEWRTRSKAFLAGHPWCAECLRAGKHVPAVLVDHIAPHKGNPERFWDETNWQGLCWSCHSRKTAAEDGGFGNREHSPRV